MPIPGMLGAPDLGNQAGLQNTMAGMQQAGSMQGAANALGGPGPQYTQNLNQMAANAQNAQNALGQTPTQISDEQRAAGGGPSNPAFYGR